MHGDFGGVLFECIIRDVELGGTHHGERSLQQAMMLEHAEDVELCAGQALEIYGLFQRLQSTFGAIHWYQYAVEHLKNSSAWPILAESQIAQEQGDLRECDDQHRRQNQHENKRRCAANNLPIGSLENGNGSKDIAAERRSRRANRDLQGDQYTNQYRIQARGSDSRSEDGREHQDYYDRVNKHAGNEECH